MGFEELLIELRHLNRADKLRAMQTLVMELAAEENALLTPGAQYEIWSPYDAPAAAQTLLDVLDNEPTREMIIAEHAQLVASGAFEHEINLYGAYARPDLELGFDEIETILDNQ